jgi:signal transduction histidine kinase
MIIKLKETASKLFMNINWSFYVEKEINFEKFNLEQRRNIFLIFKESLNNIQKHAQAKNCSISFFIEQDILVMRITDDGIGFDETINKINDGVKSINRRAEKLSAIVKITSKINQGTTVELRVPIGKKKLDN